MLSAGRSIKLTRFHFPKTRKPRTNCSTVVPEEHYKGQSTPQSVMKRKILEKLFFRKVQHKDKNLNT